MQPEAAHQVPTQRLQGVAHQVLIQHPQAVRVAQADLTRVVEVVAEVAAAAVVADQDADTNTKRFLKYSL